MEPNSGSVSALERHARSAATAAPGGWNQSPGCRLSFSRTTSCVNKQSSSLPVALALHFRIIPSKRRGCGARKAGAGNHSWCCVMFKLLDILLRRIVQARHINLHRRERRLRTATGTAPARPSSLRSPTKGWSGTSCSIRSWRSARPTWTAGSRSSKAGSTISSSCCSPTSNTSPSRVWTHSLNTARYLGRRILQFNPSGRARRNVAHHYDIDGAIYDLFLDGDRQYSCALLHRRGGPRGGAARQETPSRRQARHRARTSACSTSARAGAASASISPRSPIATSPA